jgi:hypothetical protein
MSNKNNDTWREKMYEDIISFNFSEEEARDITQFAEENEIRSVDTAIYAYFNRQPDENYPDDIEVEDDYEDTRAEAWEQVENEIEQAEEDDRELLEEEQYN